MPSAISSIVCDSRVEEFPAGCTRSEQARRELLALPGEPLWLCDWTRVVFLHFEVDADSLQREVPFQLDLYDGRAFVSLVTFTLADMRPRYGGRLVRQLFKPFGTHRYLNVRTYVREHGHIGIYFLAEWLDAPWLNLLAGPLLYGLPFRCGRMEYHNRPANGRVRGAVRDATGTLCYAGKVLAVPHHAEAGSLAELLIGNLIFSLTEDEESRERDANEEVRPCSILELGAGRFHRLALGVRQNSARKTLRAPELSIEHWRTRRTAMCLSCSSLQSSRCARLDAWTFSPNPGTN